MTPLQQKFLKAIAQRDKIAYSTCSEGCECKDECEIRIEAAKACEQICIEEMIALLQSIKMMSDVEMIIFKLQAELKTLTNKK